VAFPDINKLCNDASYWIYIGVLLAHPILHISMIKVKGLIEAKFTLEHATKAQRERTV
jgi:hypothetical protein